MRKSDFCIGKNKDEDQLRGNREADKCLCFRNMDSTTPLLSKSKISILWPSSVAVQPGLCRTWSETPKTVFPTTRLIIMFQFDRTALDIAVINGRPDIVQIIQLAQVTAEEIRCVFDDI